MLAIYAGVHLDEEQLSEDSLEAFDPLRDGPLRYMGYANELGEAFAAWLPAFGVPASYCIALGYSASFLRLTICTS